MHAADPRSLQFANGLTAGRSVVFTQPMAGPLLLMVGMRDAWGTARVHLSNTRDGTTPLLVAHNSRRIGPANEVPFWIPAGIVATVEASVVGINDGTTYGAISANGLGLGALTGTPEPRAWCRALPPGASVPFWRGQAIQWAAFAGADAPSIPFGAPARDQFCFPLGGNFNFHTTLDQQMHVDLVGPDGSLITRLGTSVTSLQGCVGPWMGLKVRNLSAGAAATGQLSYLENMQRVI